jgi:sugar lactone lactonase YvrE
MSGRRRGAALCVAMGLVLIALVLPATAGAAAGDVYVADVDYPLNGGTHNGAILRIPPAGGPPTVINADPTIFRDPNGMLMEPSGTLLVADYGAGPTNSGSLIRVDPASGAASTFVSGPPFTAPTDVARDPDGSFVVVDENFGAGTNAGAVFRVSPSGSVSTIASGAPFEDLLGVAVSRSRTIYVADEDFGGNNSGGILRVDPTSGAVTPIASGTTLDGVDGIALSPDEKFLYAAVFRPNPFNPDDPNKLVRVDLATGQLTTIAGFTDIVAEALLPDGGFLISNTDFGTGQPGGKIQRVGPGGSPITDFSTDPNYNYPHDIVVEPARCGGQLPTVVGTDGPDVLQGSAFADVIAGLGGRDTINGLQGKDTICGGAGKDKLVGGAGKDKLFGGKGNDKLIGGKGKDKCVGGKGNDTGKSCEKGKL